ncbi:MAG: Tol-Pal system beta propeller repeat protein TolB [Desulfobacteraceae bacterium]|nr:Tol-Pal system beta propeller repeat protein TolB [Desulfobacteraceae bacterium]
MLLKRLLTTWVMVLFVLAPINGLAEVKYIDLTNPFIRKIPMAVPEFKALTPSDAETALTVGVADQVAHMLDFTGYFKLLDRASFLYDPRTSGITQAELKFANWTTVGAELLVTGGVQVQGGELILEMRLFDTFKGKLVVGKRYNGRIEDQRAMVKRFCTEVIQALTGNAGVFNSRLAFASKSEDKKEIYTCEFDGTNVQRLTNRNSISSMPNWSSDGRHLAYISFVGNSPARIVVRDLQSNLETVFDFPGTQIAPAWVPGRFELSATLTIAGDPEIYLLTGGGKVIKRITYNSGIDVDSSWSPDGKKMAFVSKRAGTPQIFVQEMDTGRIYRVTFQGQYNTQPSWSPKGDRIAYSALEEGQINIYTIDIEGNRPIRLTYNQGDNEAPSWSPDGSLIAFISNREGQSRIYVMTAIGTDQRRLLVLPGEQSLPKWSPNISP